MSLNVVLFVFTPEILSVGTQPISVDTLEMLDRIVAENRGEVGLVIESLYKQFLTLVFARQLFSFSEEEFKRAVEDMVEGTEENSLQEWVFLLSMVPVHVKAQVLMHQRTSQEYRLKLAETPEAAGWPFVLKSLMKLSDESFSLMIAALQFRA